MGKAASMADPSPALFEKIAKEDIVGDDYVLLVLRAMYGEKVLWTSFYSKLKNRYDASNGGNGRTSGSL